MNASDGSGDRRSGVVVRSTRRFVDIADENYEIMRGKVGARNLEVSVGDRVRFSLEKSECVLHEVIPPKNRVSRSYGARVKVLATNVDHLLIVTAVGKLFNTVVVDRMSAAAYEQGVPCTLLVNKVDLEEDYREYLPTIELYRRIGMGIIEMSAKFGKGMEQLRTMLAAPDLSTVMLGGVSGVGKSTILNALVPGADVRTRQVSRKTGQGKQTTSYALAHLYERPNASHLFIVDLPGVQNFGVAHLDRQDVVRGLPEIFKISERCEFDNCSHIREQKCAVRAAVESGEIAVSRYLSYVGMVEEIEAHRPY